VADGKIRHVGVSNFDPWRATWGEQQARVLVVDLVGAIAGVVAEPISQGSGIEQLLRRLLGQHLEAEKHAGH
jgi:aryl-alcohol dehydrogenase-like predicted oxidoreductase